MTVLCCIALPYTFTPVRAADGGRPPVDSPGQWRRLGRDDAESTSRCIGRPRTPLCAVETLLACFQRGQIELCRMVDDEADQYAEVFTSPADPARRLFYRIVGTRPADGDAAGDVLISLDQRDGTTESPAQDAPAAISNFRLRAQQDGSWKIVGWGEPAE
jgi:hypothetical protein